jgi:Domain of unknown function (DUF3601)
MYALAGWGRVFVKLIGCFVLASPVLNRYIWITKFSTKRQITTEIMEYSSDIYKLEKGKTYRVIKVFIDYDRITHKVGEVWIFDKMTFLPYHSGLTLFATKNDKNVSYRFQSEPEEQEELLHTFMNYVEQIEMKF